MGRGGLEPVHLNPCYKKTLSKSEKYLVRNLVRTQSKPTEPVHSPCPELIWNDLCQQVFFILFSYLFPDFYDAGCFDDESV